MGSAGSSHVSSAQVLCRTGTPKCIYAKHTVPLSPIRAGAEEVFWAYLNRNCTTIHTKKSVGPVSKVWEILYLKFFYTPSLYRAVNFSVWQNVTGCGACHHGFCIPLYIKQIKKRSGQNPGGIHWRRKRTDVLRDKSGQYFALGFSCILAELTWNISLTSRQYEGFCFDLEYLTVEAFVFIFQWWESWAFHPGWWRFLTQPMILMLTWQLKNITPLKGKSSTCQWIAFGWCLLV